VLAHRGISSEQDLWFIRGTELQQLVLWEIRVCFDLVNSWHNLRMLEKGGQGLDAEVGDADISDFSCEYLLLGSVL